MFHRLLFACVLSHDEPYRPLCTHTQFTDSDLYYFLARDEERRMTIKYGCAYHNYTE